VRIPSLRLIVPAFLAVAAIATPALARTAPAASAERSVISASGIYRLTISAANRPSKTVHMVVREEANGMSGVVLDNASELSLSDVRYEGNVLKASIMTTEGRGEIELTLSTSEVTGTLIVAGKRLTIRGEHYA
jgi:hypothetical protein